MTIALTHVLTIVCVATAILLFLALVAVRTGKTTYPVRCVHCWICEKKETIVAFEEQGTRWAICPECTKFYWRFTVDRAEFLGDPSPVGSLSDNG